MVTSREPPCAGTYLVVNAVWLAPAVTVPGDFLGKPVPVTLTDVPAGPDEALSMIDAVAASTGSAAREAGMK